MLELIALNLDANNMSYFKFTGSLSLVERNVIARDFNEGTDKRILLISLKAGGEGLNLQSADHVFLVDPWWNPAVELQAIQRAHRIGQTAGLVKVVRFIIEHSIEERIIELQRKKRLFAHALIDSSWEASEQLNNEDIRFLLSSDRTLREPRSKKHKSQRNTTEISESEIEIIRDLRRRNVPFELISKILQRDVKLCQEIVIEGTVRKVNRNKSK